MHFNSCKTWEHIVNICEHEQKHAKTIIFPTFSPSFPITRHRGAQLDAQVLRQPHLEVLLLTTQTAPSMWIPQATSKSQENWTSVCSSVHILNSWNLLSTRVLSCFIHAPVVWVGLLYRKRIWKAKESPFDDHPSSPAQRLPNSQRTPYNFKGYIMVIS